MPTDQRIHTIYLYLLSLQVSNSNSGSNISSTLYTAAIVPGLVESLACKKKMRDQAGNYTVKLWLLINLTCHQLNYQPFKKYPAPWTQVDVLFQ
jgi:hypothetical protein